MSGNGSGKPGYDSNKKKRPLGPGITSSPVLPLCFTVIGVFIIIVVGLLKSI